MIEMCGNNQLLTWTHSKRRLGPSNSLFEEGNIVCCLLAKQLPFDAVEEEDFFLEQESHDIPCGISGCSKMLDSLNSYELHYNSTHRNACSACKRTFPTSHLLDIHLLEWHDSMFDLLASKSPMFQCLLESCGEKFINQKDRKNHMIKCHKFPANFRFERTKKEKKKVKSEDKMEVQTTKPDAQGQRMFSYKVPSQICFGHGSALGFQRGRGSALGPQRGRGRGGKKVPKKHWHQVKKAENTTVDIGSVDMTDLAQALDTPKDSTVDKNGV
ncbi:zinc finger protein 511-like [Ostrea edulis]|uniref:zinc finger protein 511-like n=1 Tax=Ostrea edulis TaxID=37623 RepID=UPI0020944AB2|nr:zinc finger protein 511-like [Ostrea edulis]XP_056020130.1 zinc finger protein 511-like [Ostrea edulis]